MSFIRSLDEKQILALSNSENYKCYELLKKDMASGQVFASVRKNQLYFYYKGGCLYKFSNGKFTRDKNYANYSDKTDGLSEYEKAKKQIENRFTNSRGISKERKLLDDLNCHTFCRDRSTNVIVLDIEVNLNGSIGGGKKCDIVLYNLQSRTLMFVEGKVFSDSRVNVKCGAMPEVIEQVNTYTAAIGEQEQNIIEQYANHVRILNRLFETSYEEPLAVIKPAKLLVYETPSPLTENNRYSIEIINSSIKENNVAWFRKGEKPSIDEIWKKLCK